MNTYSALSPVIARYLALKQALGYGYRIERPALASLDRFLAGTEAKDLTQETFSDWCKIQKQTPNVRRSRMSLVRNLCLYRQRTERGCFVPDIRLFPLSHPCAPPYIFTKAQITQLIQAAGALIPRSPLHAQVFRLAIVLLYTTGMRRGELLNLTLSDYDPQVHTLLIRESKFHKSRYLPLSSDAAREIDAYLQARRNLHLPMSAERPLLWNGYGSCRAYSGFGLMRGIKTFFQITGIRTPEGRLPRIHDFRHTFAVHALLRWYRTGADLQAKLPLLATYMGHVSIKSTQYYLPFIEGLASAASDLFAVYCGSLIMPMTKTNGGAR